MPLRDRWDDLMGRGLAPGIHRFDGKGDLAHHRFHLRVDSQEKGMLIIDASHLLQMNGTALDYVRCVLEERSDDSMYRYMSHRYKGLEKSSSVEAYRRVRSQLIGFIHGDDQVVEVIGSDRPTIGSDDFPAPYRMDLILTYRCQNRCSHCYNEPRELKELTPEQWKEVITKLWDIGVPHIVFTGGEPTLYPQLDELIARSEELGQVTGLVSNGRKLREQGYLKGLVEKGLDHVQITVLSHRSEVHDRLSGAEGAWDETIEGLKVALKEDLYVSTNTTIMRSNIDDVEDTLRFLIGLGVKNIAFNGLIRSGGGKSTEGVGFDELGRVLDQLKGIAAEQDVRMTWYTPTPYCELNPINHGLSIKQCTACSLNMAIEPDGSVLPCQSFYRPLGNILTDDWKTIWNHDLCKKIRARGYLDGKCTSCELRDTCGGGCPLAREHGDYACLEPLP